MRKKLRTKKRKCKKPTVPQKAKLFGSNKLLRNLFAFEHFQLLRNRKAQVAIEFIVLIVVLFSVFMVYTISTRKKMDEIRDKKEYVLLKDITKTAQNEILMAVKVEDGYQREFELPEILDNINYTINITNGVLIMGRTELHDISLPIPWVNGTLQKGTNIIRKENGNVKVN